MQKRENTITGRGVLGSTQPSKQVEDHPAATLVALVTKRPGAPARERLPNDLGRPQERLRAPPLTEIFLGSVESARARARQVINEVPPAGYIRIVEGWQQLADGHVRFTIRRLSR